MGTDGNVLANQRINIGIDNTAHSNGVKLFNCQQFINRCFRKYFEFVLNR